MYRHYRWPSIWREMDRLQQEMNRLFDARYGRGLRIAPKYPAMNVWTNEENQIVTAEIPGVSPEEVELSVLGDMLTIKGSREADERPADARYHRRERGYGSFSRTIQLPYPVDVDHIKAEFKNGVISISLPRAEEDRPKRIAVKRA